MFMFETYEDDSHCCNQIPRRPIRSMCCGDGRGERGRTFAMIIDWPFIDRNDDDDWPPRASYTEHD